MLSFMSCNSLFLLMVAFVAVKCSVTSGTEIPTSKIESNSAFVIDQNVLISLIVTICGLMLIIIGAYCCYKRRKVSKSESKSLDKVSTVDAANESENEIYESDVKPRFEVQYMKQQPTEYQMDLHVNSSQNGHSKAIQTQETFTAFDI
eukprot:UN00049